MLFLKRIWNYKSAISHISNTKLGNIANGSKTPKRVKQLQILHLSPDKNKIKGLFLKVETVQVERRRAGNHKKNNTQK